MGSDYMSVETGALDRHAKDLEDHANDARLLYERFNKSMEALGEPWGEGDSYAESFREWYDPAHRDLLASLQGAGAMLAQVHAATTQASTLYKRVARQSQHDVGGLARQLREQSVGSPVGADVREAEEPAETLATRRLLGIPIARVREESVGSPVGADVREAEGPAETLASRGLLAEPARVREESVGSPVGADVREAEGPAETLATRRLLGIPIARVREESVGSPVGAAPQEAGEPMQ
ncbi:hypothetical protein [Kitasatospora sp. NPDC085879]|uniref:hypothetical protein n=1 Tax=Kitasatospora sp. NPDC085879 TaxID=3154769 RepID=UPI003444FA56